MLYFAYGVNMNHKNMSERCPGHKFLGPAMLAEFKFAYDGQSRLRGGGIANIIPNRLEKVWGGLFEVSEMDLKTLDRYEGAPKYFQRQTVKVRDAEGKVHQAVVYRRASLTENQPAASYQQEVREGAEDCQLPADYIKHNL